MTPRDFVKSILNGRVEIDFKGHNFCEKHEKHKYSIEHFKDCCISSLEFLETSEDMFKSFLDKDLVFPTVYFLSMFGPDKYNCSSCAKNLAFRAVSENKIDIVERRYDNGSFSMIENDCDYKDGTPIIENEIDVPTGKLVFTNFFKTDKFEIKVRISVVTLFQISLDFSSKYYHFAFLNFGITL
jgi:hypothetical protein